METKEEFFSLDDNSLKLLKKYIHFHIGCQVIRYDKKETGIFATITPKLFKVSSMSLRIFFVA